MLVRESLFEDLKYFKGKSDEDIEKNLEQSNLSIEEQFKKALLNDYVSLVKKFIEEGKIDPSFGNNYPIRRASENGSTNTVKYLLTLPNVDPTTNDNYAIYHASVYGHLNVIIFYL